MLRVIASTYTSLLVSRKVLVSVNPLSLILGSEPAALLDDVALSQATASNAFQVYLLISRASSITLRDRLHFVFSTLFSSMHLTKTVAARSPKMPPVEDVSSKLQRRAAPKEAYCAVLVVPGLTLVPA